MNKHSSSLGHDIPTSIKLTVNKQDASCDSKGAVSVTPTGGTPVYTYLWDDFVKFGGVEVYLTDYVKDFLTNYVIEQRSYRIAT